MFRSEPFVDFPLVHYKKIKHFRWPDEFLPSFLRLGKELQFLTAKFDRRKILLTFVSLAGADESWPGYPSGPTHTPRAPHMLSFPFSPLHASSLPPLPQI
jgi:hypothetical protein